MKKYLEEYTLYIDNILKSGKVTEEIKKEHLIKIGFFQHERLIHLLVTLFYGLFTFIFFYFSTTINSLFLIIFFILLIFLLFYVVHYFRLENGVQYLYKQYDEMLEKKKTKSS